MRTLALFLFGLSLSAGFITGCSDQSKNPLPPSPISVQAWAISAKTYHFSVDPIQAGTQTYPPFAGFKYLIVTFAAHNNLSESASLSGGSFALEGPGGSNYSQLFAYDAVTGRLPLLYDAKQTQTGDVYFLVPVDWSESDVWSSDVLFGWDAGLMDGRFQYSILALYGVPLG